MAYSMILVTCPEEAGAEKLARDLVDKKLAACVQIHPVKSVYAWENQVHTDLEFRLVIKTRAACYPSIEAFILEHHGYEVPQIVEIPIQNGFEAYLDWIDQETRKD